MKTTTNYLILNQTCVDLLITFSQVTLAIHYSSMENAWFGGLLGLITCNIILVILTCPYGFSVWILAAIAVDRFYAVTRPLRASPISQHFKTIILILWIFCLAIPATLMKDEILRKSKKSFYCDLSNILQGWTTFNIFTVSMNVPLPLLILAISYTILCLKLWSRDMPGEGLNQDEQQAQAVKTARKVTLMMICISVLYLFCWFPFFVLVILQYLGYIQMKGSFLLFVTWLTATYSALNPYIYLMFSQNFRNRFKKLFKTCTGKILFCTCIILPLRKQSVELGQV